MVPVILNTRKLILGCRLARYIPALPKDPINDDGVHVYTFRSTTNDYEINARLESASNTEKMLNDGGNEKLFLKWEQI
jgi:hypothetical protein